jgi:predicted DNA-binding protein
LARTAETIGFSVPPRLKKEVEELARKSGMTKSELFREMVRVYKQAQFEKDFYTLQKSLFSKARERGVYTEEDVEQIIYEDR